MNDDNEIERTVNHDDELTVPLQFPGANRKAFSERVEALIRTHESASDLARKAGVSEAVMRKWRKGISDPSREHLLALASAGDVSLFWLATGEGPMRPPEWSEAAPRGDRADLSDFALVPYYDVVVSTGAGAALDDSAPVAELAFRRDWLAKEGFSAARLVAIRARGDSMAPTIVDGSLLLVDTAQRELAREGISVLRWNDHLYAKRVQRRHDGSVRISSDNREYAEELLDPAAAARLDVIGRVIWIARRCW